MSDAWQDFESQQQALENTSTQDCVTACRALESLARAAQHICDVAPDHCEDAKARLAAASDRVHAACPQCEVRTQAPVEQGKGTTTAADSVQTQTVASEPARGGCAGCAVSSGAPDAAFVVLMLMACKVVLRRAL
jgi:hypothetical protein